MAGPGVNAVQLLSPSSTRLEALEPQREGQEVLQRDLVRETSLPVSPGQSHLTAVVTYLPLSAAHPCWEDKWHGHPIYDLLYLRENLEPHGPILQPPATCDGWAFEICSV